jgi:hypothetical protein
VAIFFKTKTPNRLLTTYKTAVDAGRVRTWSYDADGDFTHTAEQWKNKAWFRPRVETGELLVFNILAPTDSTLTADVYGLYHGRFVESMLAHCDRLFNEATITALAVDGDIIG